MDIHRHRCRLRWPVRPSPATGELILHPTSPSVTGVPAVPFYIQGVFVEPGGDIVVGNGSLTVLLDASL